MNLKKFLRSKKRVAAVVGLLVAIFFYFQNPTPTQIENSDTVKVIRVVDGDTIEIEGGEHVRYIGVDTPELSSKDCYGQEAAEKNRQLVEGKEVRLEKDISETDRYDRLLRYVYVGDIFVNEELVKQGYAQVSTYPPDVKYNEKFLSAQTWARENNLGFWTSCSLE